MKRNKIRIFALYNIIGIFAALLLLSSCGTQRQAVAVNTNKQGSTQMESELHRHQLAFVQKVSDNAVYAKNISSKISFTLRKGGKDLSVDGQLHMRRNEVIRIQLAPLGLVEVGRIEFTPQQVLILIRPTKEYIQASYDEIDFLHKNGLNFYSLQALFWNQLFLPGQDRVSEQLLERFVASIEGNSASVPVSLNDGQMTYKWTADRQTGRITQTDAAYNSKTYGTSSLVWKYADFQSIGSKSFPCNHNFTLTTPAATGSNQSFEVTLKLKKIDTAGSFDAKTTVSPKYKQITVEQAIRRIMNL